MPPLPEPSPVTFRVVAQPNPYRADRYDLVLEAGSTLDDVLVAVVRESRCNPAQLRYAAIVIGDRRVEKSAWSTTCPPAGATVIVKALPDGDFGSLFITAIGFVGASLIPGGFLGLGTLGVGLLKAGISIATSLIASAIAPSPKQTLSSGFDGPPDARHSITGTQNRANPYGLIPDVYGRVVSYHPPLAAAPYTEVRGGDLQYIRMLFAIGHGTCSISDIRIGETAIDDLEDVSYRTITGSSANPAIGLFPGQVREESLAIQLKQVNSWSQRTTPIETDEISLDVLFPNGMQRITNRNVKFGIEVQFQVQYRAVGSATWLNAPFTSALSVGVLIDGGGLFRVSGQYKSAVRRSVGFDVTRGQYQVRIRRVTIDDQADNEGEDQSVTTEDSYWSTLRSVQHQAPVNRGYVALLSVRARATDQLNGVIDQLNCVVERTLPVWNGSTWTNQVTRNPAWAFVNVLTGRANARAVSTSRLDLTAIKAWADRCDAAGYQFDGVIDFDGTVWETLQEIASAGRASPTVVDGLYSVVEDRAQTVYRQVFTPHNSRAFQAAKVLTERPHAIKVRFPNAATDGQVDERIVYDDGYSASNATRFEALDLRWTTSASQAWKFGRYALAAARLRPEIYQIETDWEHLPVKRGDLVAINYDVILVGLGSARVKSVTLDGSSNATAVVVDMPQIMEAGKSYAVEFRVPSEMAGSGSLVTAALTTVVGEQSTLTFATPIAAASPQPAAGDLVTFGEAGSVSADMIVRSIQPRADRTATVTLVDAAPAVHTADSGTIPDFDPQITLRPITNRATPQPPVITSIDSDEDAILVSNTGQIVPQILVGLQAMQSGATVAAAVIQGRYRETTASAWIWLPVVPAETPQVAVQPVEQGRTYALEFRAVSALGLASEWTAIEHTVVGLAGLPADVERLFRERDYLIWRYDNPPLDFAGFRVKANAGSNTNWARARQLHAGLVGESRFYIGNLSGTETVMVKAVDVQGNESAAAAIVTLNLGDPLTENLLLTQSEDPSFSGTITNGSVVSNELVADTDSDPLFWAADGATFWGANGDTFWPTVTYAELQYVATYSPVSGHIGATIQLALDITGEYYVEFRESNSPAFWGSDGSTFWGSDGSTFWAASDVSDWTPWPGEIGPLASADLDYDIRVTVPGGAVQGTITAFDIMVDVPDIVEYFEDVAIAATGTPRLTLTKTYRAIKVVNVTVQDDAGSAITARIVDKDESAGPNIETLDASGARAAGTIDAVVIGY